MFQEAQELARAKQEYELILCEYNVAQCFTPVDKGPSRMNQLRERSKRLNDEIDRDGRIRVSTRLVLSRLLGRNMALLPKLLGLQRQLLPSYHIYPTIP